MPPEYYRSAVRPSAAKQAVRKLGRLRRSGNGRLESLGHDFDRGHREYVERLPEGERLWLRTKPFSAPPSFELAACLRTFAHVVDQLGLGVRAQVLDVGCGPGWMSEYLARCGYWVTGVDISEDMVEIARLRVSRIPEQVGDGVDPFAEFHAMPVREMPWTERFEAAILYDTMHHFDNELETLRVIHRTLVPGGTIYIREGARPAPGSESEKALINEMRKHETLESLLTRATCSTSFARPVSTMRDACSSSTSWSTSATPGSHFERSHVSSATEPAWADINTVVGHKPLDLDLPTDAANFSGRIESLGPWDSSTESEKQLMWVEITKPGPGFLADGEGVPVPIRSGHGRAVHA